MAMRRTDSLFSLFLCVTMISVANRLVCGAGFMMPENRPSPCCVGLAKGKTEIYVGYLKKVVKIGHQPNGTEESGGTLTRLIGCVI